MHFPPQRARQGRQHEIPRELAPPAARAPVPRGRALLGLVTQALRQSQHGRVWGRVQLLLKEGFVRPRVLDRRGRLSRRHEGGHEAEGCVRAEWIQRGDATPPVGCRSVVAARGRVGREALDRLGDRFRQARPLVFDPTLEVGGPVEVEAVEERAGIERGGARPVTMLKGVFESRDVTRDDCRIEP